VRRLALAAALLLASAASPAQSLFKCTDAGGRVTYQETPCAGARAEKRMNAPRPETRDEVDARRLLEREAMKGDELAGRFADDARGREAARQREREALAREERDRRLREARERPAEEVPWNTPWGFPAKPGQALPPAKPKS
jgi:hypothetical protein